MPPENVLEPKKFWNNKAGDIWALGETIIWIATKGSIFSHNQKE